MKFPEFCCKIKKRWTIQRSVRLLNGIKAGRLCHLIPALTVGKGGGRNEKIHIESNCTYNCFFVCAYYKSKIAPTDQVWAI